MNPKIAMALQAVMWMVCIFHVATGAGLNLSPSFVDPVAQMYGADVGQWSPQFLYILRPLGVFMVALGVWAAAAAIDPEKHRLAIYVFVGIFAVRATQRLLFGAELQDTFGIDAGRNMLNMVFFYSLAAILIVLDLLARRSSPARPTAT